MFLTERTSKDLGWDELKDRISAFCQSEPGRDDCRSMPFLETPAEIQAELSSVMEACDVLSRRERPSLGDITDVTPDLARAAKGGTLAAQPLLNVARLATTSNLICGFLYRRREHYPAITARYGGIDRVEDLAGEVRRVLHDTGDVKDSASPVLAELRSQMLRLREGIIARFREICSRPLVRDMLQDDYYTIRNGRYVIPVKVSFKNQVKGIIHDSSQTGETLFIEPVEFIEPGNDIKICESRIDDEIERLLAELTRITAEAAGTLRLNLKVLRSLDVLFAKAELTSTLNASVPSLGGRLSLPGARHPLLVLRGVPVVENDITLEEGTRALLISGPNAGGKTVVLKTAGLASLMTAAGIPPPVSPGASVPMYTSVHTVFGDAQDLGGDLSSFSGHVMQINSIVDRADNLSLVLLDEIASDTDPREGAALAAAIIEELTARGATVLATSHFHELREWASGIPGVLNASVGFDLLRLKPSFRLEIGVSGESFALRVASGLGLPARIVEGARKFLGRAYVEGERILTTLKGREDELERSLGQARELEKRLAIEFEERRRALDAELAGARAQVEKDRESITTELKAMRDRAAGEISKLQKSPDMKSAVDTERWLSDVLRDIEKKRFPAGTESKSRAPSPGDRVDILTMGMTGTVESINLDRREASVVSSGKRLTVPLASIVLAENPREQPKPRDRQIGGKDLLKAISQARSHEQIQDEVDLRGMYTDEGVSELDAFLDASFRNDIDLVRIIHGHGTGALKMAVRDHLRRSDYVASSRPGAQNEGGDGVTVVTLKK